MRPTVYLIGSMEHSPDGGKDSFATRAKYCQELGYNFINPVEDEEKKTGYSASDSQGKIDGLRKGGKHQEVRKIFDAIWRVDIKAVQHCDFLWGHIEPTDKLGGTIKEITLNTFNKSLDLLKQYEIDHIWDDGHLFPALLKICLIELVKQAHRWLKLGNNKPIYVTCFGARTGINGSVEHMIYQTGGKIFGSWVETIEYFKKTYGSFPQVIKNDDLKKQEKEEEKK